MKESLPHTFMAIQVKIQLETSISSWSFIFIFLMEEIKGYYKKNTHLFGHINIQSEVIYYQLSVTYESDHIL